MNKNKAGETKHNKKRLFSIALIGAMALIFIIVANLVIWNNHLGKQSQVDALTLELNQVNQQISQSPDPAANLESRLQAAKADLATAQEVFPSDVSRNDIIDFILNIAEASQVEILPLVSEGSVAASGGQPYIVMKFRGTVTGSLEHANDFMTRLHNGKYPTLMITGCTVQSISGQDIAVPDNDIQVTVSNRVKTPRVNSYFGHCFLL